MFARIRPWSHDLQSPIALIVESDAAFASRLGSLVRETGYEVIADTRFDAARRQLSLRLPEAVIANVRLESFNGIHLAYLAKLSGAEIRVIIYARRHDPLLAREAQRAGAFYERQALLPHSVKRLITVALPPADRRQVDLADRRRIFRGGRRTTDLASPHLALTN